MKAIKIRTAYAVLALGLLSACSAVTERGTTQNLTQPIAAEQQSMTAKGAACEAYGPQSPRDIDQHEGANKRVFSLAPSSTQMNLCNIHFHNPAEHKAAEFSVYAGDSKDGNGAGYQCKNSQTLSAAELKAPAAEICNGVKPGDTIEMHWVYSSCDVKPGEGLGSCLSPQCANPDLRVETQVFTVVNDPSALDFNDFDYAGKVADGYHQPDALPTNKGKPVEYLGSTTGPAYSEQKCSPLQVSWSVRPQCAKVDINSLGRWCEKNAFNENKAHGIRPLVTNPELLSDIERQILPGAVEAGQRCVSVPVPGLPSYAAHVEESAANKQMWTHWAVSWVLRAKASPYNSLWSSLEDKQTKRWLIRISKERLLARPLCSARHPGAVRAGAQ